MSYTAPSGCPGIDGYLSDVRARATRLNVEPEPLPGAGETVEVIVEPEPGASTWRGRVSITGERALEREVRSERCEDVVAALALITVLRLEGADTSSAVAAGVSAAGSAAGAVGPSASGAAGESAGAIPGAAGAPPAAEPSASEPSGAASPDGATAPDESAAPGEPAQPEPGENAAEEAAPEEAGSAEAGPGASGAVAAEPELPEPLEPEPSIVVPRPEAEEERAGEDDDVSDVAAEPEPPSEPWQWPVLEGGLAAYGGYASVPAHAVKATLEGELRFGEGVSSWAALLSLAYAHGDSPVPSGELGLTLLTAQLGLCPPAFVNEPSVWIRGCASLRGGGLRSTVSSSDPTFLAEFDQHWGPWLAVGPSLSAGVPLSERLALRGLVELAVQLVRDRFNGLQLNEETGLFEPFVLYQPEALSIELGLGLGYTF